ncbi:MAG: Crp/Fnr family transcriptional regulator [Limnothrix sp. BL-A-16]|jgi:CRP-like cAMP-binding protein
MNFRDFPAFRDLTAEQFQRFLSSCQSGTIPADRTIIHQGKPGSHIFFLSSGQVRITLNTDLGERELNVLSAPTILGEISFFSGELSSANVTTATDVSAIAIGFNTLRARLYGGDAACAIVTLHLASTIAERAAHMTQKVVDFYGHQAEIQNTTHNLFGEWSFL